MQRWPRGEVAHLRLPVGVVGRELVQEDDRRAASRLFSSADERYPWRRHGAFRIPLHFLVFARNFIARPGDKLQLILAAAIRQSGFIFAISIIAESPRNRFHSRHMKSSLSSQPRRKTAVRVRSYDERRGEVRGCSRGSSMRQLFAFRRSLRFIALALCSVSIVVFVSPASARPHHGAGRHARAYHAGHHAEASLRSSPPSPCRRMSRLSAARAMQAGGFADTNPSYYGQTASQMAPGGFCSPSRRHGGARRSCAVVAGCGRPSALALGARRCADAGARSCQRQRKRRHGCVVGSNATVTPAGGAMASGFRLIERRLPRRAAISAAARQGRGRLWCARFIEHGPAAFRLSRHRLGHGELVREIRPARFRSAGRRHRRDVARPPRRPCRRHHRRRCFRKSDRDLRQQRQPRPRGPVSRGRIYAYVMPTS